ncbi:hypothetical protein FHR24_002704 [Wenyingzhuangia heitensis]|uniref:Uncharacterized protein n=1 Tax=Wenyingzhuangia heitensis TaxID=1487859 RepID=A0ABX0UEA4_9FLAO|nr:hypothetical protein [Wenyingzhuangia heitensis]NIJ46220.1 hypothetical protein [Wenyingzhuangia heitensis]
MKAYKVKSDWNFFRTYIISLGDTIEKDDLGIKHNNQSEIFIKCSVSIYEKFQKNYELVEVNSFPEMFFVVNRYSGFGNQFLF